MCQVPSSVPINIIPTQVCSKSFLHPSTSMRVVSKRGVPTTKKNWRGSVYSPLRSKKPVVGMWRPGVLVLTRLSGHANSEWDMSGESAVGPMAQGLCLLTGWYDDDTQKNSSCQVFHGKKINGGLPNLLTQVSKVWIMILVDDSSDSSSFLEFESFRKRNNWWCDFRF